MRAYILPHPPIAVPEVGGDEIKKIEMSERSFAEAAEDIAGYDPETIVIISPHSVMYSDAFYIAKGPGGEGNLARFNAPRPNVYYEYDTELCDEIAQLCKEYHIPVAYSEEGSRVIDHGAVVPLYFINQKYRMKDRAPYRIVRISPSFLSDSVLYDMGYLIERAIAHVGRRAVIIASGDLSHKLKSDGPYGFVKEGPLFDIAVTDVMKSGKLEDFTSIDKKVNDLSANCGYPGFVMLAGALQDYKITPRFLSYEGPFGVGYGFCIFECENWYVRLAKSSLEKYIRTHSKLSKEEMEEYPDFLRKEKAGVFVCIKKKGQLRGCIGTILPSYDDTLEETVALAISAGTNDPRFPEVTEKELPDLVYTVDVMGTPEKAERDQLDVRKYGVIVTAGWKRGLLLPNLEGVDTVDEQLEISCRKGGISPAEDYKIERFIVERHT
ncbi:MAG: AmmeMemoRadiSam system protein A [Lachnospiraceae bacterium]|nr:AmmeMemoRadiSam system protein A [Lachnospiraceae bacterium]